MLKFSRFVLTQSSRTVSSSLGSKKIGNLIGFTFLVAAFAQALDGKAAESLIIKPSQWVLQHTYPVPAYNSVPAYTTLVYTANLPYNDGLVSLYFSFDTLSPQVFDDSTGITFLVPPGDGMQLIGFGVSESGSSTAYYPLEVLASVSGGTLNCGTSAAIFNGSDFLFTDARSILCLNSGTTPILVTIKALTLSPGPAPSPSPSPTPTQKIVLYDNAAAKIPSGSTIVVSPSVYQGLCTGIKADAPQNLDFAIFCVDTSSGLPVSGCRYSIALKKGISSGGHDHDRVASATRPVGIITPETLTVDPQPISLQGATFDYEATDIAQDVDLTIVGIGSDGKAIPGVSATFRIQDPASNSFRPISIAGLEMNVVSHPDGIYGTPEFTSKLANMVDFYFGNPIIKNTVSNLESQGATLPLGGLFDTHQDWTNPHCGHRDGKTIDITTNTDLIQLTEQEKKVLERAVYRSGLDFKVSYESPTSKKTGHWHVQE